jgi:hypothetical protein
MERAGLVKMQMQDCQELIINDFVT